MPELPPRMMLRAIRSSPMSSTISDFRRIVLSTGMTAVSSAALFAALSDAFATLIRMLRTSIIQIRHTAASRKSGMPKDASTVTLPFFVPGADTLSLDIWDLLLCVYFFIAVNIPFSKIQRVDGCISARGECGK